MPQSRNEKTSFLLFFQVKQRKETKTREVNQWAALHCVYKYLHSKSKVLYNVQFSGVVRRK